MVDETGHSTGPHLHYEAGKEGQVKAIIDGEEVWINTGDLSTGTIGAVGDDAPGEAEQSVLEALLITNMRLYDVMMGVYNKLDNPRATEMMKAHREGRILSEEEYNF